MEIVSENDNKAQLIILGSLFFAISLIALTLVINSFILANLYDETSFNEPSINTIQYENKNFEKNVEQAASPKAPLEPNEVNDNYISFMLEYENQVHDSIRRNNIIHEVLDDNIKTAWEFGNINESYILDDDGNSNWNVSSEYDNIHKGKFKIDVTDSTDFNVIGQDSEGNLTWEMSVNDSQVTFSDEVNEQQDSISISSGENKIKIVEEEVNDEDIETYHNTLENSDLLRFEGGSSVEGIYRVQMDSEAVFENPCDSPCIENDLYRTGILKEVSVEYRFIHNDISSQKELNINSNINKMVIGNDQ